MKKFSSKYFDEDCRICGINQESPLAINRAIITQVLKNEKLHYHKESFEYYIFLRGRAKMIIEDEVIEVSSGEIIMVEPYEKHKIEQIIEEIDYIIIKTNNNPEDKIVL